MPIDNFVPETKTDKIMKQLNIILLIGLSTMLAVSCNSLKPVKYADMEWHISDYYGQIIDRDTTFRMTFGDVLIPEELTIISCLDSCAKYPGMERFVAEILKTAGLQDDEVLFYSPVHGKMFVRIVNEPPAVRPSSLSSNMNDDRPYTMWIYDDDVEDWYRKAGELYTYTYFDKKKKRILVVDFYDYGEIPVAQISVIQSRNKMTDKMQLLYQKQLWNFSKHDLKDYKRDIEFWSHWIDQHRTNAFANYKIGQEQLSRQK